MSDGGALESRVDALEAKVECLTAEVFVARQTTDYWKGEHLAGNTEIERLRADPRLALAASDVRRVCALALSTTTAWLGRRLVPPDKHDEAIIERVDAAFRAALTGEGDEDE